MFFAYLWKKKWIILGFILLAVAASVSMASFNIYIAPVFDDAQAGNYSSVIWRLGVMFLWYIATRLLDYYTELIGIHVVNTVRQNIKQDLFSAVMNKQLMEEISAASLTVHWPILSAILTNRYL